MAGGHFGVLEQFGLPVATEQRFVGGFMQAQSNGQITFFQISGTYQVNAINTMQPQRIADFIRGTGAIPQ
jgi:hypothetical protein